MALQTRCFAAKAFRFAAKVKRFVQLKAASAASDRSAGASWSEKKLVGGVVFFFFGGGGERNSGGH